MSAVKSGKILLFFAVALTPVALVTLATTAGCYDLTPIYVAPKEAGLIADAGCTKCLEKAPEDNGCDDILSECNADPRCAGVVACLEAFSCFDRQGLDDKLNCGLPCTNDAGITTTGDPVITTLLDLVRCAQVHCPIECQLGDAALSIDGL
jgi:hypothetical protein